MSAAALRIEAGGLCKSFKTGRSTIQVLKCGRLHAPSTAR